VQSTEDISADDSGPQVPPPPISRSCIYAMFS
jgi:hypothetical protein